VQYKISVEIVSKIVKQNQIIKEDMTSFWVDKKKNVLGTGHTFDKQLDGEAYT
jgi:hypothetical protein